MRWPNAFASNRCRVMSMVVATVLALMLTSLSRAQLIDISTETDRTQQYEELARQAEAWDDRGNLVKKVVRLVKPSVVHVEARKTDQLNVRYQNRKPVEEAGSGVVLQHNDNMYVLTNRHVISQANISNILIVLADGRRLRPSRVWSDMGTDVAVMAVSAQELIPARFGDSDRMEIGDFVVAVGSPFGLNHSVTFGIISAKGRRELELGVEGVRFQNFMQTDAAINPGNSGGPLLNLRGEVIGLNTAIASNSGGNEGIGFSIPGNIVLLVARQLIEHNAVSRGYLGVQMNLDFTAAKAAELGLSRKIGVLISSVTPNSPADLAGLQVNDVIIRYGNVLIEDAKHLINLASLTSVGKEVELSVIRDGTKTTVTVNIAKWGDYNRNG